MEQPHLAVAPRTRVVIFMTAQRATDIPGTDNRLACLLPLGSASFAERVMESCALSGVRMLDVVVSDYPESVRAVLGDGSAWGLQLRWHLAKDSASPYKVLHGLHFADGELVVIGHGHQWLSARVLRSLLRGPGVAMHMEQAVSWSGWHSESALRVCRNDAYEDCASMAQSMALLTTTTCVLARVGEFAKSGCASELLDAQNLAFNCSAVDTVPASWRRMPWGAMSPDAIVSASARMTAPVLIGPGCVVDGAAQLGPKVVLSRDIFICDGAEIRHTVVLPNTYVDGRVTLDHAVVQGNAVQNLKWDVRTVLAQADAMLTPLIDKAMDRTPVASRVLALLLVIVCLPICVLLLALQWLLQRPILWRQVQMVKSRNFESGELQMATVRQAHSRGWLAASTGLYGSVLDIVQGRRRWFGLRPRSVSEWYALGRDWQNLFSHRMFGVFHAPSWAESADISESESLAVADAFMAVHGSLGDQIGLIVRGTLRVRLSRCQRRSRFV